MKYLELEIEVEAGKRETTQKIHLPLATPEAVAAAQTLISIADKSDKIPGDHKAELKKSLRLPVKVWMFNLSLPIEVSAIVQIVDA